jgi:hypothetical protein
VSVLLTSGALLKTLVLRRNAMRGESTIGAAGGFPVVPRCPPHQASPDRRMVIGGFEASIGSPEDRGFVPQGYGTVPGALPLKRFKSNALRRSAADVARVAEIYLARTIASN